MTEDENEAKLILEDKVIDYFRRKKANNQLPNNVSSLAKDCLCKLNQKNKDYEPITGLSVEQEQKVVLDLMRYFQTEGIIKASEPFSRSLLDGSIKRIEELE